MSAALHIVCPRCEALNRLPRERLSAAPNRSKCQRPLFEGNPVHTQALIAQELAKEETWGYW